tara:strand:- start:49997 stop:50698 length:702 start_codon:yes stop_codon:yes gene_type:complete
MKRFYKTVGFSSLIEDGGFVVYLDGKPLKTPGKKVLVLPSAALAREISNEWEIQIENIHPEEMNITRLACTIVDHIYIDRNIYEEEALQYAKTDTVCYRVSGPQELLLLQKQTWNPLIRWMKSNYGIELITTDEPLAIDQHKSSLVSLRKILSNLDEWSLGALLSTVRASGSLIIGLALYEGFLDNEQAFEAAELETTWQIQRWGEDTELINRRNQLKVDFLNAKIFLDLIVS